MAAWVMAFASRPPRDRLFPSWVGAGSGFEVKVMCLPPSLRCPDIVPCKGSVVASAKSLSQSLPEARSALLSAPAGFPILAYIFL